LILSGYNPTTKEKHIYSIQILKGRYKSLYIIECAIPRANPNGSCGLQLTMMRKCRFINCNKYPTVVGDVYNGGGCAM
jgi:hypothetical protein